MNKEVLTFSEVVDKHQGKYSCRALISATNSPDSELLHEFIAQTSEPYDFKGKMIFILE